ncbi:MAG: KEOPS complex subunit Cgi121, partial [Candidatus Thermoplasmatota archaeon]|nr:KEOPS complex subunit Cgi121 [Candidatus Thermoplasmatota archaeon]
FTVGSGRCHPGSDESLKALQGPELALVDAQAECAVLHLRQAAELAQRAHTGGYALSHSRASEVLLYLTGQRQVSRAIDRAGLTPVTEAVAWVAFGEPPTGLADQVTEDEGVLSIDDFDYQAFGLPQGALDANPAERWPKLVLTRCALLPVRGKG